jgi:hypothetical protein
MERDIYMAMQKGGDIDRERDGYREIEIDREKDGEREITNEKMKNIWGRNRERDIDRDRQRDRDVDRDVRTCRW